MLELDLEGDIEIAAELDFTYGFDLTVCCVVHQEPAEVNEID
jgi:hypothetical protein